MQQNRPPHPTPLVHAMQMASAPSPPLPVARTHSRSHQTAWRETVHFLVLFSNKLGLEIRTTSDFYLAWRRKCLVVRRERDCRFVSRREISSTPAATTASKARPRGRAAANGSPPVRLHTGRRLLSESRPLLFASLPLLL